MASTLSAEEERRAQSFPLDTLRKRFVVAHGALRAILAAYLGRTPADLRFTLDPGGKPRIRREAGEIDLRFSLSHSGELALVAVANGREVGVDIERVDATTKVLRLAQRYFAREEDEALRALPTAARVEGFFRCWTLKEAYLKALGGGLRLRLNSFAVSLGNHESARLLWSAHDDARNWTLQTLAPAEQYAAAVVTEGEVEEQVIRDWLPHGRSKSVEWDCVQRS